MKHRKNVKALRIKKVKTLSGEMLDISEISTVLELNHRLQLLAEKRLEITPLSLQACFMIAYSSAGVLISTLLHSNVIK